MTKLIKSLSILIIISCLPVLILAQTIDPKISISPEQNLSKILKSKTYTKGTEFFDFLGEDDEGFLVMKSIAGIGKEFNFLFKYDSDNFDLLMSTELNFPKLLGKKPTLRKAFLLDGKLCVFISVKDAKNDKDIWFVQRVDGPEYILTSNYTKLWESPFYKYKGPDNGKKFYDYSFLPQYRDLEWALYLSDLVKNDGDVKFYFSPDSSKILIDAYYPLSKKYKEKHSYLVLDDQLKVLSIVEKEYDYEEEQMKVNHVAIDNRGNFYSLLTLWSGKTASNFTTKYEVVSYQLNSKKFQHISFAIDYGFDVEDMGIAIGKDNQVFIHGIYNKNRIALGWFSTSLQNNTITKMIYKDFSEAHQTEIKKAFAEERSDIKGHYYLRETGVNPVNGNIFYAFEYEYAWWTGSRYEITSGDVIYIDVSAEDGDAKLSRLSKLSIPKSTLYPNYGIIHHSTDNYIFYNDLEISNLNSHKIPTLGTLNKSGYGKKHVVFEHKSTKMNFDPANYMKLRNGNEFIFLGKVNAMKHHFVKFTF